MRWFGESWDAPVCHEVDHIDTPVDMQCTFCPCLIDEDDQGFEFVQLTSKTLYEDDREVTLLEDLDLAVIYCHRDCLLKAILPRAYHPRVHPPV